MKENFTREEYLNSLNELAKMYHSVVWGDDNDTDFVKRNGSGSGERSYGLLNDTMGIVLTILDSVIPEGKQCDNAKSIAKQMLNNLFWESFQGMNKQIETCMNGDDDDQTYVGGYLWNINERLK